MDAHRGAGSPCGSPPGAAEWLTARRFLLLLGLLLLATFPGVLLLQTTFVYRDFGYVTVPFAGYLRESLWNLEIPLWNPLSLCGLPFLAQWNVQALYPPAVFYVIFPVEWSVGVFCVAHLAWGGLGMFLLARRWTSSSFGAAAAGVAFAFSGVAYGCLTWVHTSAALAWMPWVIGSVEQAIERGGRLLIPAALIGTFQMLTGTPEIIMQTWLIVAAMALTRSLFNPGVKLARGMPMIRLCVIVLAICGLAAVQLLPFLDFVRNSHRTSGYGGSNWAMPGWGWANFFVPLFGCSAWDSGVFHQRDQYWISSYYLGVSVAALAFVGSIRAGRRKASFLAALATAGILLAMGENVPFYGIIKSVFPPIGFMRYPVKLVVTTAFCAPLLMAWALAKGCPATANAATSENDPASPIRWPWIAAAGGLSAIFMALLWGRLHPVDGVAWDTIWKSGASRAALLVATCALLAWGARIKSSARLGAQIGVLLLLWADLATHSPDQQPLVDTGVYARNQVLQDAQPRPVPGASRVMLSPEANYIFYTRMIQTERANYLSHRAGLYSNCNLLENLPKVDGFYSLYPREVYQALAPIYFRTNGYPPELADFLGVSHVNAPGEIFKWEQRPSHRPIVSAGQAPIFAPSAATLEDIHKPTFDSSAVVYLPESARGEITVTNRTAARIVSRNFTPHRIQIEVTATEPSLVVIAQSYYHFWHGTVDGRPATIWPANHGFQAVQVPAGNHTIQLAYVDQSFRIGCAMSGLSWCALAVAWFRRKPPASTI